MVNSNITSAATEEKVSFRRLEGSTPIPNMQVAVIVKLLQATIEVTKEATQRTVEAGLLALKSTC